MAAVTMSAGVLTACSGGDYCSELQNYAEAVKNLDVKDTDAVDKMQGEAKKLSKSAPDDLKDDWKTVDKNKLNMLSAYQNPLPQAKETGQSGR